MSTEFILGSARDLGREQPDHLRKLLDEPAAG